MKDVFYEIPFCSTVKLFLENSSMRNSVLLTSLVIYIYLKDSEFGKVEGEISHGYCGHPFISNSYRILLHKGL